MLLFKVAAESDETEKCLQCGDQIPVCSLRDHTVVCGNRHERVNHAFFVCT